MSQVPGSSISWHYSLKIPLWLFPAARLFRLMQPPATLPHIVLGSGWRMSLAKNSLAGKKIPLGFQFFYKLLYSYKGRIMGGKEFARCILQAKGCARARHGWQDLVTWSAEAPLWRQVGRTRTQMSAEKWLLLRLGQGKVCGRLLC